MPVRFWINQCGSISGLSDGRCLEEIGWSDDRRFQFQFQFSQCRQNEQTSPGFILNEKKRTNALHGDLYLYKFHLRHARQWMKPSGSSWKKVNILINIRNICGQRMIWDENSLCVWYFFLFLLLLSDCGAWTLKRCVRSQSDSSCVGPKC